jgi:hypothetical protein
MNKLQERILMDERDSLQSKLDSVLELWREIEFFLRGRPGEASVLRAKIAAVVRYDPIENKSALVEKHSSLCSCGSSTSIHNVGCPLRYGVETE